MIWLLALIAFALVFGGEAARELVGCLVVLALVGVVVVLVMASGIHP